MVLRYGYTPVKHADGTRTKIPLIPISILREERLFAHALIDSGADMCAMFRPTAELLGIPLEGKKEKSRGIGGGVETVQTELILQIQQGSEKHIFSVPMKIILTNDDFPILLGQDGFFNKFIIKFNKRKDKFSLKRVGKLF